MRLCLFKTMESLYNRIPKRLTDALYYTAFSMVLIYDYAYLTRFERGPFRVPYVIGAVLAGIVLCIRFLNVHSENRYTVGTAALLVLIGLGYCLVRHSFYFFVLSVLMAGALRVEDRKLLALYLVITAMFFAVMLTHYFITTPDWKDQRLHHFGSINTTDCQNMIFFLLSACLFLTEERIPYIALAVMAGIVLWFWYYTRGDISMYCSVACLMIAAVWKTIMRLGKRIADRPRRILGYLLSAFFLVCAAIMIVLSICFDPDNGKWAEFNSFLHLRLTEPHKMYLLYPPRLWGSEFQQVGWGYEPGVDFGSLYRKYGFTYIDSSYPQILINHGYLVLTMILGVMTWVSVRYARRGELYRVLLLAVLAVDFAAEGHMKELSCNVWLLLPFAAFTVKSAGRIRRIKRRRDQDRRMIEKREMNQMKEPHRKNNGAQRGRPEI